MKRTYFSCGLIVVLALAGLAPAANDFSGDSDCYALYNLESGALTTDSQGTNTLTDANGVVASETCKEGSYSGDFEKGTGQILYCADGDLDAGFPLKNGDSQKTISVCFWSRLESENAIQYAFSKGDANGKYSFHIGWDSGSATPRVGIGWNNGASVQVKSHANDVEVAQWYHYGVTYNDATKTVTMRIWDDNASSILGTDLDTTVTNNINVEDGALILGALSAGMADEYFYDGLLDEVVVFDDILSSDQIDQIRGGTYSAGGGGSVPIFHSSYQRRRR